MATVKKKKEYQTFSLVPGIFKDTVRTLTRAERARRERFLAALAKSSQSLAIEKNVDTILEGIAKSVGKAIHAKYVNFWDFTPDKKGVYIRAAYGMHPEYLEHSKRIPLQLGTAWIGRAVQTGKIWATSNVQKDPRLPATWLPAVKKQGYYGLVCMPLKIKDRITGGMCIYYDKVHEFEPFEMTIAGIVANQAATAVENSHIFDELEAERLKTLSIVRSLTDGLIMYDLDGTITFFNPKAEELLWLSAQDLIGKRPSQLSAETDNMQRNLYALSVLSQADYENTEYSTEGPHRVVLLVTRIPVRDEAGNKIGTMQVLHDVTHEQEVEQLKASFLTTASHQIRTPLAGMKWALAALLNGENGALTPGQKEMVDKMFQTNEHLIVLMNDLLDVSRIEEGQFGYNFKPMDLLAIVRKVVASAADLATRNGVALSLAEPARALRPISVDEEKIRIAIENILDNAIKYTPRGGAVSIAFEEKEDSLAVLVRDNGIGIPEKEQAFIFNRFFRARNAVLRVTEGSGLGLYITKNIVNHHHAVIRFESRENAGSTFTIEFPLSAERMPVAAAPTAS